MKKIITTTQKTFAVVAGMALVVSMFGYGFAAQAQTSTTTTVTTTTVAPFTRDLTIGSTGADVTALQVWLIANGFSIPAGATGYFGTQTRAAVSAYQVAHGIQPTAGYFGPITRTSINAMLATGTTVPGCTPGSNYSSTTGAPCTGTTVSTVPGCLPGYAFSPTTGQACTTSNNGGGNNNAALSGGEADLRNFDLLAEDGEGAEAEQDVKAATAEFDVEGGDINVQRAELTLHATNDSDNDEPWDYIDSVSVWDGGTKLATVNADDRNDWDEEDSDDFGNGGSDSQYTITIDDLDDVIRDGDTADLTFTFDIADNIDTDDLDQEFDIAVLDDGIRAIDAAGIQQYVGDDGDTVNFGFNDEENGDLSVRESSDNPNDGVFVIDTRDTSDEQDVLGGEIRNRGDADSLITDMTFTVDTNTSADLSDVVRRATLDIDGDTYRGDVNDNGNIEFDDLDVRVDSNDTMDFTLSVEIGPTSVTGIDEGDTISFNLDGDDVEAEGEQSGDDTTVDGSITGSTFTLSTTGLDVSGTSNKSNVTTLNTVSASYGTYTIRFDVTAGDDDIYIPKNAGTSAGNSTGVRFTADAADTFAGNVTAVLSSSADQGGAGNGYYRVNAGDTESFTLSVTLDPNTSGTYEVDMTDLYYNTAGSTSGAGSTLVDFNTSGDSDFDTDPVYIPS